MKLSARVNTATVEVALSRVPRAALIHLEAAVMDTVLAIHRRARENVHVITGRLRNSIGWEMEADGLSGQVGTNVSYAEVEEFGSSTRPPHPYLVPAFYAEVAPFEDRLRQALARAGGDAVKGAR